MAFPPHLTLPSLLLSGEKRLLEVELEQPDLSVYEG
jgi:hypothetical protein